MANPNLLTISQVSQLTGFTEKRLWTLYEKNMGPKIAAKFNNQLYYSHKDVEHWYKTDAWLS